MFEKIIGNEKNKELLSQIIEKDNISHSYMFVGKSGIGKYLFAREFAKAVLCTEKSKPCNKCKACIQFENNNNPDIFILDEKDTIKNDQIKELIRQTLEKPIESKKKVYIINNSENMTREAQNSLLKTLEEPPEYMVIILIAKNENLLLNTIKSRCTKIKFDKLKIDELAKVLKEKFDYNISNIKMLDVFDGSIEKALNVKGKEELYEKISEILLNELNKDIIDFLKTKDIIFNQKEEINNILEYMNIIFYEKSKNNLKYINCIKIVEETKDRLKKNSNYDMTIDRLLFNIWEEING